jgi:hypothetical protein
MKDANEETLRSLFDVNETVEDSLRYVQFCLMCMFKSKAVGLNDKVTVDFPIDAGMDFEELLGALLRAEHQLKLQVDQEGKED